MFGILGAWLALTVPLPAPASDAVTYGFATRTYFIEMKVAFPQPYQGRRLVFYSSVEPQKELCYSGDGGTLGKCLERFVGAVAVVTFSVRRPDGRPPEEATIRELVTVTAQSPDLPKRPPFAKTVKLIDGIGSDIQVFGYDRTPVKKAGRFRNGGQPMRSTWRLYRQQLYVDDDVRPFAIVEWKHSLDRISIVQIYAPPEPATLPTGTKVCCK